MGGRGELTASEMGTETRNALSETATVSSLRDKTGTGEKDELLSIVPPREQIEEMLYSCVLYGSLQKHAQLHTAFHEQVRKEQQDTVPWALNKTLFVSCQWPP